MNVTRKGYKVKVVLSRKEKVSECAIYLHVIALVYRSTPILVSDRFAQLRNFLCLRVRRTAECSVFHRQILNRKQTIKTLLN